MEKNDIRLSIYDEKKKEVIEAILEISSKYNDGSISKRKMQYSEINKFEGVQDLLCSKGMSMVEEDTGRNNDDQELNDAIKLYVDLDGDTGTRYVQGYIWYLCMPTVETAWNEYKKNMSAYKKVSELAALKDEFVNIAFEVCMKVLPEHASNLQLGKIKDGKGDFKYLLSLRMRNLANTKMTEEEFSQYGIDKSLCLRRHARAESDFEKRYGHIATDEEMAKFLGISVKRVRQRRQNIRNSKRECLDQEVNEDGDNRLDLGQVRGKAEKSLMVVDNIYENFLFDVMQKELTENERKILLLYLGYNAEDKPFSIRRIGREVGISPYLVNKSLTQALNVMKPYIVE